MTEGRASFGGYRFDAGTGRLWSGSKEIRLTPKASAVLKMLVAHAGEPVTRDELFATVWNDTVVTDDALTSCIQELRRALEDDARQPRFIETRHRRGYRFVAPLSAAGAGDVSDAAAPIADISAIAVLPFADMSPGRDQDYLCEGLAEEPTSTICAACLHGKAGEKEEALDCLERLVARGWGKRDWIEHDPDYDILRDDPRFKRAPGETQVIAGISIGPGVIESAR